MNKEIFENAKKYLAEFKQKVCAFAATIARSPAVQKVLNALKWTNLRPRLIRAKEIIVDFTKRQPKTAAFIYVCLFCAFSIGFLDKPIALSCLDSHDSGFWGFIAKINPVGWWFLILVILWLVYMAVAGLSLTTEAFEKNMIKAHSVLLILLALSVSSLFTLVLNILLGRYTPEFLETMRVYDFSALRFRVSETSFPSFGAQSIWVVAMAFGAFQPRFKKAFRVIAGFVTVALVLSAQCFLSDAVMGTYVGIIMYHATMWGISENRENFPLISL